jgi:hypothetical protein
VKTRRAKHVDIVQHQYTHDEIKNMIDKRRGLNKAVVTEYSTAKASLQKR